jgi:hypothetical protein
MPGGRAALATVLCSALVVAAPAARARACSVRELRDSPGYVYRVRFR